MAHQRKPTGETTRRPDGAPLPSDSGGFSIETTTMRLKSLKLRRQETEREPLQRADEKSEPPPVKSVWDKPVDNDLPAGRVRHDERGMAVWDWAVASGEFATLSATNVMQKLDVADLKIEETQRALKTLQPQGRDVGGGGDPYNQRGSGQRPGEAAKRQGITGSPDRNQKAVLDQLLGKK